MIAKAAVVIGVDRTGGLEPLACAAESAVEVGTWLRREGYKVRVLTDANRPLHANRVKTALKKFVTNPVRFDLLLVYFSGHGSWHARSDRWLFSGAPEDGSDAINLEGAMDLARCSGIETVVFISDACRTIPPDGAGQRIEGIDAFPNLDAFPAASKVDYFKATSEARVAYEASIQITQGEKVRVSILTEAWKRAYEEATPAMILKLDEDGRSIDVVPNRRLEDYLQPKVNTLLALADPTIVQLLDVNVPSADDVYIAPVRIGAGGRPAPPPSPPGRPPRVGSLPLAEETVATIRALPDEVHLRFDRTPEPAIPDLVESFESQCGLAVYGTAISRVASTGRRTRARTEVLEEAARTRIRLTGVESAASVGVLLDDRRSFVLPVFAGYIGHVFVDDGGVSRVSYVPSAASNERFSMYEARRDEIDSLRARVADAVDRRRFRVRAEGAYELALAIRIEKALDPSLGLYAAHAYSTAGLDDEVVDVLGYMRDDLGTSMFDVVMLASRRINPSDWPRVPFCPLLTQAWSLVRPRGFEVHPFLDEIRPYLQDSLWTTFGGDVGAELVENVAQGVFG